MEELNTEEKMTDYSKYYWANEEARKFLSRGYINETLEQRIKDISNKAESILKIDGFATKFEDYMSKGYYSLSTPVWINFGKDKGLPISCFGSHVDDSLDSILNASREIGMMSKYGGGTSAYLGNIRPRGTSISTGGKADGPVHYARLYDTTIDVCKQSEARRGACAVYLPLEHDDIDEFLDIGTEGNPIQNLQYGVTVTDKWIEEMKGGDSAKRKIWAKVIQRRSEFGFPYIMFKDTVNNNTPYKELGLEITHSNLCVAPWTKVDIKINGVEITVSIESLNSLFKDGNFLLEVKSYNIEKNIVEYKKVLDSAQTSPKAKVINISPCTELTQTVITCTPEHSIYTTNRGYVMAKDLTENDITLLLMDNGLKESKINVYDFKSEIPVYDITVEDNHNFFAEGMLVHNCSEISLANDTYNSFVCCLGSINLLHWDEIEKTDAIEIYTLFLNAVMDEFIYKSYNMAGMKRAWRFASQHRAIGVGVLGYHSLLQSKLIPFESLAAKSYNNRIFATLKERTEQASRDLYVSNPEKYKSIRDGYANVTLIAIAPTKSSSFILGQVSMGIEPIKSNYFIKDLAKIKTVHKNTYLIDELNKYELNNDETWKSILERDGSVQHLDFPTKEVFKTFLEISPKEIILQAAQRQQYIDQSQSLNLMIHPSISTKDINQLYLYAHAEGIKTLYYQFSQSSAQSFARDILTCVNCES